MGKPYGGYVDGLTGPYMGPYGAVYGQLLWGNIRINTPKNDLFTILHVFKRISKLMFEKRLFIASHINNIDVNARNMSIRQNIRIAMPDINVRFENDPHITFRFLGKTDISDPVVLNNLEEIHNDIQLLLFTFKAFSLNLGHINMFPGVLYYSIEGENYELRRLRYIADSINKIVQNHGFSPPDYDFVPHITIGSFNNELEDKISDCIANCHYFQADYYSKKINFNLDTIMLMESIKHPNNKIVYQPAFQEFIYQLQL